MKSIFLFVFNTGKNPELEGMTLMTRKIFKVILIKNNFSDDERLVNKFLWRNSL